MRLLRAACLAVPLLACDGLRFGAAAGPDAAAAAARQKLAARALSVSGCRGDDLSEIGAVHVFELATAATVSGKTLDHAQTEHVVRLGVATLCGDASEYAVTLLVCTFLRTPVVDASGDCGALLPGVALLANAPLLTGLGTIAPADVGDPSAPLIVRGLDERWGLAASAPDLPDTPPSPEAAADLPGLDDLDADGDPGVTLHGDGEVPTVVFAARQTRIALRLEPGGRGLRHGPTEAATVEAILGGPASRAVGVRRAEPGVDGATFLRADGRAGSPRADANGDGQVSCEEAAALFNRLPELPTARCE